MAYSNDLHEVSVKIFDIISDAQEELGLRAVYLGDPNIRPDFPAADIQAVGLRREIKGTHKFSIAMEHEITLAVFKMGDQKGREEDIMRLIVAVREKIETDPSLGGLVIFAYVGSEELVDIATPSLVIRGAMITVFSMSEQIF